MANKIRTESGQFATRPGFDYHGTVGGYTNRKCKCEPCKGAWRAYTREWARKWREKNPGETPTALANRKKRKAIVSRYQRMKGCADCGVKGLPSEAYDFDHLENKRTTVSRMCDVVCATCHRIRTFNRRNGDV